MLLIGWVALVCRTKRARLSVPRLKCLLWVAAAAWAKDAVAEAWYARVFTKLSPRSAARRWRVDVWVPGGAVPGRPGLGSPGLDSSAWREWSDILPPPAPERIAASRHRGGPGNRGIVWLLA